MTTFFTSDEHYDHLNIIRFQERPFKTLYHMQSELIQRHNAVVQPEDTVWHLGDFALSEGTVPGILKQLNGSHYLLCGNHDPAWFGKKKRDSCETITKRYLEYGFKEVHQGLIEDFYGFRMCHFPYLGLNLQVKHLKFRPDRIDDRWLLHGHSHQKIAVSDRAIDVGVDAWNYQPVSLDTLIKLRDEHNGA